MPLPCFLSAQAFGNVVDLVARSHAALCLDQIEAESNGFLIALQTAGIVNAAPPAPCGIFLSFEIFGGFPGMKQPSAMRRPVSPFTKLSLLGQVGAGRVFAGSAGDGLVVSHTSRTDLAWYQAYGSLGAMVSRRRDRAAAIGGVRKGYADADAQCCHRESSTAQRSDNARH